MLLIVYLRCPSTLRFDKCRYHCVLLSSLELWFKWKIICVLSTTPHSTINSISIRVHTIILLINQMLLLSLYISLVGACLYSYRIPYACCSVAPCFKVALFCEPRRSHKRCFVFVFIWHLRLEIQHMKGCWRMFTQVEHLKCLSSSWCPRDC